MKVYIVLIRGLFILVNLIVLTMPACMQSTRETESINELAGTKIETTKPSTATPEPSLSVTEEPKATSTNTETPTPTLTPTRTFESLGRIFPEEFQGQAIWSDAGGNESRNFQDQGWFCPPVGSTTTCQDHVIHFDVSLPVGFSSNDFILSPVDGVVSDIYDIGAGQSMEIVSDHWFLGLDQLLNNTERINRLGKGVFIFDYEYSDIRSVSLHLAHVLPIVKEGMRVEKGQNIANVEFNVPFEAKVAYVIYVHMIDGTYWQFGPCDVENDDEFCGVCTSGSPYCPYEIKYP
jgi:hypothetical protein